MATPSRFCTYISFYVYKTQHAPRPWSLNMVQLSTEAQLIKAVCTAEMQCDGFSRKINLQQSFFSATPFGRATEVLPIVTTRAITTKAIACRNVVASNRAQVVRSYNCATTTRAIFQYPLSPAPIVIIDRDRVSHLSHLHRASVSRYSLQAANSPH